MNLREIRCTDMCRIHLAHNIDGWVGGWVGGWMDG